VPKIVFKGITKADDPVLLEVKERPQGAKELRVSEHYMWTSLVFALPCMLLCLALLFVKKEMMQDFPMIRPMIPLGILLGIACCLLHELLHAVLQPKEATAYIGFIPSQFMFYMKCKEPISKKRFIAMALLPMILGVIPLIAFLVSENQTLNAIFWPMAMIGLVSPAPDYLNVYHIIRQVPAGAYIQDAPQGMCWFVKVGMV